MALVKLTDTCWASPDEVGSISAVDVTPGFDIDKQIYKPVTTSEIRVLDKRGQVLVGFFCPVEQAQWHVDTLAERVNESFWDDGGLDPAP